jgi:recombination protein RecA
MHNELQQAIDSIHVRFGEQALVRATRLPPAEPWPTGQAPIDRLSGIGGLPRGRISVLQGGPGSGKLSLGLALLARATRVFAQAVVLDGRRGFDPWTLEPLEPDLAALTVLRPPTPPAGGEAAVALARAGVRFMLVLDALPEPALAPLESAAARSGCAVVAVDEAQDRALAFASSLTLGVRRTSWVVEHGLVAGLRAQLTCLKNKLAPPGAGAEVEIRYVFGPGLVTTAPVSELFEEPVENPKVVELPQWPVRSAAV